MRYNHILTANAAGAASAERYKKNPIERRQRVNLTLDPVVYKKAKDDCYAVGESVSDRVTRLLTVDLKVAGGGFENLKPAIYAEFLRASYNGCPHDQFFLEALHALASAAADAGAPEVQGAVDSIIAKITGKPATQ